MNEAATNGPGAREGGVKGGRGAEERRFVVIMIMITTKLGDEAKAEASRGKGYGGLLPDGLERGVIEYRTAMKRVRKGFRT